MENLTLTPQSKTVKPAEAGEVSLPHPSNTSISLAEAQERTKNWREAAAIAFPDVAGLIPRGFVIPMETIKALATQYPGAAGARVYFTLNQPGYISSAGITGVLVPVKADAGGGYKDIILTDPEVENATSIYDFTAPCPRYCDWGSDLFNK